MKNTWKTRKYGSGNIEDFLVGKDGDSGDYGFGYVDFELYSRIVDYHIKNEKNLVVINDLVRFPVVESEYITYLDMTGHLDVRKLLTIVDESDNFINTGTSPMDLAAYYCDTNIVIVGDEQNHTRTQFTGTIQKLKGKEVFRFYRERKNFDELFDFLTTNTTES